jgi:hypothetical protein
MKLLFAIRTPFILMMIKREYIMKRKTLALLVPALLVAGTVNAAEIYNKNGNKLDFYGKMVVNTFSPTPIATTVTITPKIPLMPVSA